MIDHLDPRAATTSRPATEPRTMVQTPAYWRRLADEDFRDSPRLAEEYRKLAAALERYLARRGV